MLKRESWEKLEKRMERLKIYEDDLVEHFILGSGPGGQKIQKSHSTVYLKHIPSGIEVKCQKERSREANRFFARRMLCEKLEEHLEGIKSKRQQKIEKIRRQKRKRSKRAKEKMLAEKKKRGEIKEMRRPPTE